MIDEIINAIWQNNLQKAKKMIKDGKNINSRDEEGWTALICASHRGYYDIFKYLVQYGPDLNFRTTNGTTALIFASTFGHFRIVECLVQRGADLNIRDRFGTSALIRASRSGHFDIVKILVEAGADIDNQDINGWTALKWTKINKYPKIVEFIEQYPAYLAAVGQLIPKLAPRISLASCARIFEFV